MNGTDASRLRAMESVNNRHHRVKRNRKGIRFPAGVYKATDAVRAIDPKKDGIALLQTVIIKHIPLSDKFIKNPGHLMASR